ncbi:helix-turn-helix domain-containing protein [Streptomyces puniciscabiei]
MLTQREAAGACGVSRTTIRRRREAGELPGSVLDPERGWLISSEDLAGAGFRLNSLSPLSGKAKPGRDVPLDGDAGAGARCEGKLLAEERAARVAAETEVEQLRALLAARSEHIQDLQRALAAMIRVLQPASSTRVCSPTARQ